MYNIIYDVNEWSTFANNTIQFDSKCTLNLCSSMTLSCRGIDICIWIKCRYSSYAVIQMIQVTYMYQETAGGLNYFEQFYIRISYSQYEMNDTCNWFHVFETRIRTHQKRFCGTKPSEWIIPPTLEWDITLIS